MKKILHLSISRPGDIKKVIDYLEDYKKSITDKAEELVRRLIDVGIETGRANTGEYAGYITFNKVVEPTEEGCVGFLIATDGRKLIKQWKYKDGIKTVEVSPLLLAEFGSGWLAHVMTTDDYRSNELGVGQGTFPGQTHAFDDHGWFWETPDGEKHHSYGEAPTYPVYSAMLAMIYEVNSIAREVFSNE
jgi:hypothetical protein